MGSPRPLLWLKMLGGPDAERMHVKLLQCVNILICNALPSSIKAFPSPAPVVFCCCRMLLLWL